MTMVVLVDDGGLIWWSLECGLDNGDLNTVDWMDGHWDDGGSMVLLVIIMIDAEDELMMLGVMVLLG